MPKSNTSIQLVSAMYADDLFDAVACAQREVFEAAILFAKSEGFLPAPESAHAICAAAREAREAKNRPDPPTLLINISGMGYHDMSGFEEYLKGDMDDGLPSDEQIRHSLHTLMAEQDRFHSTL